MIPVTSAGPTLRDDQRDATRRRIIDAVAGLVLDSHPAAFSVPAVADRAGVSVRTVYRYFPTKEALLDALSELGGQAAVYLTDTDAVSLEDYLDRLPDLWRGLAENRAVVQSQTASPLARQVRTRRSRVRQAKLESAIEHSVPALPPADRTSLAHALLLLGSSVALFELVDTVGLDVDDAAALTVWASRALIEEAQRTKEVGHGPQH